LIEIQRSPTSRITNSFGVWHREKDLNSLLFLLGLGSSISFCEVVKVTVVLANNDLCRVETSIVVLEAIWTPFVLGVI